jgi:hypothetical protein
MLYVLCQMYGIAGFKIRTDLLTLMRTSYI